MKKLFKFLSPFVMFAMVGMSFVPISVSFAGTNSGSIWTTLDSCGAPQNINSYEVGDTVYVNGSDFDPEIYNWDISSTGSNSISIGNGQITPNADGSFCFSSVLLTNSHVGGPYKVNVGGKNDNFSVKANSTYTITWNNYDNSLLETDTGVIPGTIPTYDGATPTKPATTEFTYTFSGWTPSVTSAADNITYTATFSSTPVSYSCSDGLDNDGDGKIDYPSDLGCSSLIDTDETGPTPIPGTWSTLPSCPTEPGTAAITFTSVCTPGPLGEPCTGTAPTLSCLAVPPTPIPGTWSTLPSCPTEPGTAAITFTSVCTPGPLGEPCTGTAPTLSCLAVPPTPVNGTWSAWTPATSSCGTGTFTQTRTCVGASNGGICPADAEGTITLKEVAKTACDPTPIPGTWSTLSCSTVPGTPETTLTSVCNFGPQGETCVGTAPTLSCPAVPPTDYCPSVTGVQSIDTVCADTLCLAPNTWNVETQICVVPNEEPILGCTDANATNYNPEATQNNQTCTYKTRGPSGSYPNGFVLGASTGPGEVLGAETTCGIYMDKYLQKGSKNNDTVAVKKLQNFLNTYLKISLKEDGIFGEKTKTYLKKFQAMRYDTVLKPWNFKNPTGILYKTTQTEINNIMCPDLKLPIPSELIPIKGIL